jgi:hypothetical protein
VLTFIRKHLAHRLGTVADDPGTVVVEDDPQSEDTAPVLREAAIAEIEAKKVRVGVRQVLEIVRRPSTLAAARAS